MRIRCGIAALALSLTSRGLAQDALNERVGLELGALEADLVRFRRDLHRHPEVSGAEVRTAGQVAARLRALGLEVRAGVGGHGVVGVLRGGKAGPVVAFRADMDAVYSTDPDPVEFRSETPGVRHICGHDVHTTIGVALAAALSTIRTELPGTVVFVFQPAEERATGAKAMLAAGVFDDPKPAAIYGVHTAPYNVGQLGTFAGDLMSGRDPYRVVLSGTGDLPAAAVAVQQRLDALGTVPASQFLAPGPRDLILVAPGGSTDSAGARRLQGTIMATSLSRPRVAAAMAELAGFQRPNVTVAVDYRPKAIAGVTNDSLLTARAVAVVAGVLGAGSIVEVNQIIPAFSEDFGSFQERVPGVFFFLGVSNPANGTVGMPHTPAYVADEGAIQIGARAMAAVLLDRLRR